MELPRPSWGALRTLRARELGKILLLTIPLEISTISKGENTGRQLVAEAQGHRALDPGSITVRTNSRLRLRFSSSVRVRVVFPSYASSTVYVPR